MRCLAFWCSYLLPSFFQVFQHLCFSLSALSTVIFHHQVSFCYLCFLVDPHTFSAAFNRLDFSFSQVPSVPLPLALLEVVSVKKVFWYSVWASNSPECQVPSKHDINGPFVVSVKATNGRNGSMASHFLSQMARFSVAICLPFKACHEPAVNGPLKASHFTAI